ncbi:MAG TPA: aminotransferase class V-fold PLP-dependent enzyme [Pseudolabrys sp.]|nr:aminotransferase class V-fold PLP-dependent enzyme [Pseudolabrys sp.]
MRAPVFDISDWLGLTLAKRLVQPAQWEDRMIDIFRRLGVSRLINVSGTETPFGAAPVCQEVIAAVTELVPYSVCMAELQSVACAVVARATGAEAGCVTGCTAASIAIAVAATMTGRHLGLVEQLPDTTGLKNEVVMQKGHEVTYGQNVSQNVRLTGARVIEIGAATQCAVYQLRQAITPRTTAGLYVVSSLTVQNRLIDLRSFCEVCHAAGVPVIVDAASQSDPRVYLKDGADLVLFSAHKQFASLTAGIVAGKKELVQACMYQEHGIGRPMKPGKESVVGTIVAMERWIKAGNDFDGLALMARMRKALHRLNTIKGVHTTIERKQLKLQVTAAEAGITAYGLAHALRVEEPAIVLWHHYADVGTLMLNLSKVDDETADYVCGRIAAVCAAGKGAAAYPPLPNLGDSVEAELARWPLPVSQSQ